MEKIIDACGLSCPQPVLLTKAAIEMENFPVTVLVDAQCAMENISRLAGNKGCKVTIETRGDQFQLTLDSN
jgi:TusA-related sulfurtransferase